MRTISHGILARITDINQSPPCDDARTVAGRVSRSEILRRTRGQRNRLVPLGSTGWIAEHLEKPLLQLLRDVGLRHEPPRLT